MNTHRHTTDHAAAGRTTAGRTDPNRLANRFAGMNDPSMGDEREREVIYRAYVFAMSSPPSSPGSPHSSSSPPAPGSSPSHP